MVRGEADFYDKDRYFAPEIEGVRKLVAAGDFNGFVEGLLPSS